MGLSAWIAANFTRLAYRLAAPFIIGSAVILALLGIKRKISNDAKKQERLENRAELAEAAAEEGKENANRLEDMAKARARGPHTRHDVIDRLRDGDT
ncbi:MAG: hypothetical protein JKX72_02365 [Robiginitomaculum sp.]|nr:hypothetical protein [Robiginitomaculum sp.]